MVNEEVRRFARLLESVLRLSKVSAREVEKRLGLGHGSLNRIFNGKIDLKLRHILSVLEVLDVPSDQFFRLAYREKEDAQAQTTAREILDLLDARMPSARGAVMDEPERSEASISDADLDRRIHEALLRFGFEPRPAQQHADGGESQPKKSF